MGSGTGRLVSYDRMCRVDPVDWSELLDAVDPCDGDVVLDAMCGVGLVGSTVLDFDSGVKLFLLDKNPDKIRVARERLSFLPSDRFVVSSLSSTSFPDAFFDKAIIKMGLHEVSKSEQQAILFEVFRILKPGGSLVVWDVMLDGRVQWLFRQVLQVKDELAGLDTRSSHKYFFRESEFLRMVSQAGFSSCQQWHVIHHRLSTKHRLGRVLSSDNSRLGELNDFLRQYFPVELKDSLRFVDEGDDVQFDVLKKIFVIKK